MLNDNNPFASEDIPRLFVEHLGYTGSVNDPRPHVVMILFGTNDVLAAPEHSAEVGLVDGPCDARDTHSIWIY